MVQEVVKQVPVPQVQAVEVVIEVPQVQIAEKIVQAPQQIVETIASAPVMAAAIAAPIMSAPIVETFGAGYGTGIVGGGIGYGAPVVETFGAGYGTGIGFGAPSFATAPLVGSISAGLPMTTMAAPTVSMGPPSVLLDRLSSALASAIHLQFGSQGDL